MKGENMKLKFAALVAGACLGFMLGCLIAPLVV